MGSVSMAGVQADPGLENWDLKEDLTCSVEIEERAPRLEEGITGGHVDTLS